MDKVDLVTFRPATVADAAAMAHVHITSWREAYAGLMPAEVIAELPLKFKSRHELWQAVTARADQVSLVAEHRDYGVIGIMNGGAARDAEFEGQCEVYCLYLLQAFHGQQIGYRLLRDFFAACRDRGYKGSYAWVLEGNPAIEFYRRTGASLSGHVKKEEINGATLQELRVEWAAAN